MDQEIKKLAESFFEWPTENKIVVTLCSAILLAEKIAEREREAIREFLFTVLTINRENQHDWMEYLAERINEVCEVIGEDDRFAYNPRREAILPVNKT